MNLRGIDSKFFKVKIIWISPSVMMFQKWEIMSTCTVQKMDTKIFLYFDLYFSVKHIGNNYSLMHTGCFFK